MLGVIAGKCKMSLFYQNFMVDCFINSGEVAQWLALWTSSANREVGVSSLLSDCENR